MCGVTSIKHRAHINGSVIRRRSETKTEESKVEGLFTRSVHKGRLRPKLKIKIGIILKWNKVNLGDKYSTDTFSERLTIKSEPDVEYSENLKLWARVTCFWIALML